MKRRATLLGIAIGLSAAVVVLSLLTGGQGRREPATGPILSDADGPIRELVIHYVSGAAEVSGPVYRQFLAALGPDVTVHVVCPDHRAFEDLQARVGPVPPRLSPIPVGHALTTWSRDRWTALAPAAGSAHTTLLRPAGELGEDIWPDRGGDLRTADDLAAAMAGSVRARHSRLYFDGGDFVADDAVVFVAPNVIDRNVGRTVADRRELADALTAAVGRKVVLLETAPPHHAGMYMMPIAGRKVLVGDPSLAAKVLGTTEISKDLLPCGADFSAETQKLFDAVAKRCRSEGYEVIRMPLILGRDGRTYVTYLNAILDERGGRRIVHMPTFRGAEALNEAVAGVWRSAGYEVRPID